MRIVIAGPPKTGNVWLKRLLASTYGLRLLESGAFPDRPNLPDLDAWLGDAGFPDNSIFHQHYDYTPELASVLEAVPAHLVTIVRNPYDTFVSAYFASRRQPRTANGKTGAPTRLRARRSIRRRFMSTCGLAASGEA